MDYHDSPGGGTSSSALVANSMAQDSLGFGGRPIPRRSRCRSSSSEQHNKELAESERELHIALTEAMERLKWLEEIVDKQSTRWHGDELWESALATANEATSADYRRKEQAAEAGWSEGGGASSDGEGGGATPTPLRYGGEVSLLEALRT